MKKKRIKNGKYWILSIFSIPFIIYGCCSNNNPYPISGGINEYIVSATLYNQLSGEYKALAYQSYAIARMRLDEILSNPHPDTLSVVTDLDETILDNSIFQGQLVKDNRTYMSEWNSYVQMSIAKAVPGAVAFFNYVDSCNVKYHLKHKIKIFYITNRDSSQFNATAINLARLHFPQIDTLNFQKDSNLMVERTILDKPFLSNKEARFKLVRKRDTVLLQFGDNLNDLTGDFYHKSDSARRSEVDSLEKLNRIGKYYIVMPNAMYGDWLVPGLDQRDLDTSISRRMNLKVFR
jgi:5'-nucleotidase (lipoprotein e(P4) family)